MALDGFYVFVGTLLKRAPGLWRFLRHKADLRYNWEYQLPNHKRRSAWMKATIPQNLDLIKNLFALLEAHRPAFEPIPSPKIMLSEDGSF